MSTTLVCAKLKTISAFDLNMLKSLNQKCNLLVVYYLTTPKLLIALFVHFFEGFFWSTSFYTYYIIFSYAFKVHD